MDRNGYEAEKNDKRVRYCCEIGRLGIGSEGDNSPRLMMPHQYVP